MGTFNIAIDVDVDGKKKAGVRIQMDCRRGSDSASRGLHKNMAVHAEVTSQAFAMAPCVGCLPRGFMRKETSSRR
jgi:hypothetical protein